MRAHLAGLTEVRTKALLEEEYIALRNKVRLPVHGAAVAAATAAVTVATAAVVVIAVVAIVAATLIALRHRGRCHRLPACL